jgi:hypothetical protein
MTRYNYKRQLFETHLEDTVQYRDGSLDASFEALECLCEILPLKYPSMFSLSDDGTTIRNHVTGDVWDLRRDADTWKEWHPLQIMGLLTTEDWFVMMRDEGGETYRLAAGANCFPGVFPHLFLFFFFSKILLPLIMMKEDMPGM